MKKFISLSVLFAVLFAGCVFKINLVEVKSDQKVSAVESVNQSEAEKVTQSKIEPVILNNPVIIQTGVKEPKLDQLKKKMSSNRSKLVKRSKADLNKSIMAVEVVPSPEVKNDLKQFDLFRLIAAIVLFILIIVAIYFLWYKD